MKRLRYFTETLPDTGDPHDHSTQKSMALLGDGHWVRISLTTIMGIVELSEDHFTNFFSDHPSVVIYPSLHERISIKDYLSKKNGGIHMFHLDDLSNHCGVIPSDIIADVVAKMMQRGHTFLSPDK